jgi:putative transposase
MARPLRIEYPGAFYHVISRGNAGNDIFKTRRDREKYLTYLAKAAEIFSIRIHTYCLMTNHYHLLVETPEPNLSRAIQWLNVSYASYFNRKRSRCGHLFQGRYSAILVDADAYFKYLSRYIHLNPVRAGIVEEVIQYKWSSYQAIVGGVKVPEWLTADFLLSVFGPEQTAARRRYRHFVESMNVHQIENPSEHIVSSPILGDAAFVAWVKSNWLSGHENHPEIPQLRNLMPKCSLDRIIELVADAFGTSTEQIQEKGRKRNLARDAAIYLSKIYSGEQGIEIAHRFGLRSGSAVTMRSKAALKAAKKNKKLALKIDALKKSIMNN